METDAPPATNGDEVDKVDDLNESKGLVIDDDQGAAAATANDEEMLEDPLVDAPPESAPPAAAPKPTVTVTAQNSVKTPIQAPASDDKDKDIASRSIWVRGLTSATKAADLKVLCTQYGKVVRAKIYTSKKQSTSACYGYVTMADSASAEKAAAGMHKTQIKSRTISVEKADRSKVPAVKSVTAAASKKDAADGDTTEKRDSEKGAGGRKEDSKAKATDKAQGGDSKTKTATSSSATAASKRDETRSERKRDDKERRSTNSARRDSERPSTREFARKPFVRDPRDPRRDTQKTISAPRRFPTTRGISSFSLRGRITRPGERGGYMSTLRRAEEPLSQRDLLSLMRRKEEEHRRREAEIEKERALERERERIRFEREQLEKERLQLQLQAALQQQKIAAMGSSRMKDSYAPSSRGVRHTEYRSSRGSRDDKISSTTSHHRSASDSRRGVHESRSRHDEERPSARERDRSEHKPTASSRERGRNESYSSSSRSTRPASYANGKEYERGYTSSRGTHSYNETGGSYYGNSRDAYSSGTRPSYGSSSAWETTGGSGMSRSNSSSNWNGRGTSGTGGWTAFGSSTGGGSASGSMRYDYDKYQQRF